MRRRVVRIGRQIVKQIARQIVNKTALLSAETIVAKIAVKIAAPRQCRLRVMTDTDPIAATARGCQIPPAQGFPLREPCAGYLAFS
jgi:hypothetical protein